MARAVQAARMVRAGDEWLSTDEGVAPSVPPQVAGEDAAGDEIELNL